MPYIHPHIRSDIEAGCPPENAGELNYAITKLVSEFIGQVSYAKINAAIGALECAKLELYRRLAAPYEDDKIAENGDVYPSWQLS